MPDSQHPLFEAHPDLAPVTWVFAYGSLIWNPEFSFVRQSVAKVHGYHRAFCISSTIYRGTPATPGIVLGLDYGGCVEGVAFELEPGRRALALHSVLEREMPRHSPHHVYNKRIVQARLSSGETVNALTFVANRSAPSYVKLTESQILQRLSDCCGQRGANCEYAINTWHSLKALGLHDARLEQLVLGLEKRGIATAQA